MRGQTPVAGWRRTNYTDVVQTGTERGSAVEPPRLAEILRGFEGKWVALRGSEVVQLAIEGADRFGAG